MSESHETLARDRRMADKAIMELREVVQELTTVVHAGFEELRRDLQQVNTAFTVDDLGRPDHNGHRLDHKARIDQAKLLDSYKIEATKKVVVIAVVFLAGVFAKGIVATLAQYFG